jgi:N utilization substance protein A
MSLAIGKRGQNAKLTSKLMGWRLSIAKEEAGTPGFEQRVERAVQGLQQIDGISTELADRLVAIGINSPEAFEGVTDQDLMDAEFSEEDAKSIMAAVNEFNSKTA